MSYPQKVDIKVREDHQPFKLDHCFIGTILFQVDFQAYKIAVNALGLELLRNIQVLMSPANPKAILFAVCQSEKRRVSL